MPTPVENEETAAALFVARAVEEEARRVQAETESAQGADETTQDPEAPVIHALEGVRQAVVNINPQQ